MSNSFIEDIFNSQQARNGGIVRRSLAWVERFASVFALKAEVQRRGFHMVISGDQAVIFCNDGDIAIAC
ncbi:MAG: hypothetical protein Q8Q88_11525 [Phenylobacterium sp.]|uniref:hypothetical protein n=1 Tax=Phenylobacterium sp. TaxID=1871053 RepID=UPI0027325902|nr:hypothetical protein [Phenylobacterium sp.]MDP3747663.1 hypothetical protein [Phenylobacterium sp.]